MYELINFRHQLLGRTNWYDAGKIYTLLLQYQELDFSVLEMRKTMLTMLQNLNVTVFTRESRFKPGVFINELDGVWANHFGKLKACLVSRDKTLTKYGNTKLTSNDESYSFVTLVNQMIKDIMCEIDFIDMDYFEDYNNLPWIEIPVVN